MKSPRWAPAPAPCTRGEGSANTPRTVLPRPHPIPEVSFPLPRCSPCRLAGVHPVLRPAAQGPAGPPCAKESGQGRGEPTLAPTRA